MEPTAQHVFPALWHLRERAGPEIPYGLGYQLRSPSVPGPGPASFGDNGARGRLCVADPDADVSFGYVCNSMHSIAPTATHAGPPCAPPSDAASERATRPWEQNEKS